MDKSVLITGATGFLGGYTVDEFVKNDYRVLATGRNERKLKYFAERSIPTFACSLAELPQIRETIDTVVHIAGLSTIWGDWNEFHQANVVGTDNVVNFCLNNNVQKIIYISTPSIYTQRKDQLQVNETQYDAKNDLNNYIKSKLLAERIISDASKNLEIVILRPRGLIGIGDTSIAPRLFKANRSFGIPIFNDGKNLIDLTSVENVAYAIRLACENKKAAGNVYNITNDDPQEFIQILDKFFTSSRITPRYKKRNDKFIYNVASLIEKIYSSAKIKSEPPITRYGVCTLAYSQTLDISKAKQDLGYIPQKSLDESIEQYCENLRGTHA